MPKPRTPNSILELKGTFKQNPKRKRPPAPTAKKFNPRPPAHMPEDVRKIWWEVIKAVPDGVLRSSDRMHVEIMAHLLYEFRQDPAGMLTSRIARLNQCMGYLGLNPHARETMSIPEPPKPNKFDDL